VGDVATSVKSSTVGRGEVEVVLLLPTTTAATTTTTAITTTTAAATTTCLIGGSIKVGYGHIGQVILYGVEDSGECQLGEIIGSHEDLDGELVLEFTETLLLLLLMMMMDGWMKEGVGWGYGEGKVII